MSTIAFGSMELDDIAFNGMAWHWAAVGIGARHSPIAAPSMPPLPCCPIQWHAIGRQCMPPDAAHILQIPRPSAHPSASCPPCTICPSTYPNIHYTFAYQYPRPTRLHHVLPIPIILVPIIQNVLLLPIGTFSHPYPLLQTALRPTCLYCSIVYH